MTAPATRRYTQPLVLDWFARHPGQTITSSALAHELDANDSTVSGICSRLAEAGEVERGPHRGEYFTRGHRHGVSRPAARITAGTGDAKPLSPGTLLTVLDARTADGSQLAVCEENRVWKLQVV